MCRICMHVWKHISVCVSVGSGWEHVVKRVSVNDFKMCTSGSSCVLECWEETVLFMCLQLSKQFLNFTKNGLFDKFTLRHIKLCKTMIWCVKIWHVSTLFSLLVKRLHNQGVKEIRYFFRELWQTGCHVGYKVPAYGQRKWLKIFVLQSPCTLSNWDIMQFTGLLL